MITTECQYCKTIFEHNYASSINRKFCSKICANKSQSENKLVCGFGINDYLHNVKNNGIFIKSYKYWRAMLHRCYDKKFQQKHSTYLGCCVCDEWKYFSNFKEWFDKNHIEGYQLDKDILVQGNKVYSPETCCFVPQHINKLLTRNNKLRGNHMIGVHLYNNKYQAKCKFKSNTIYIGLYQHELDAHNAYREFKYKVIKQIADEALINNEINDNIYKSLLKYKIESY